MSTRSRFSLLVLCASGLLAGCANQTSIWRNESAAGNVMAMDAQQRVILSSNRGVPAVLGYKTTTQEEPGKPKITVSEPVLDKGSKVYYCPEPSPDAIASFASALGLGLSKTTTNTSTDAKLNSALATSVASVGLRTPTTQVIRDLITAACIADLNGSFENQEFRDAFARNQQFVLAAHAIAVIGGEPTAGQAGVAGGAGTSGPDPVAAYDDLKAAQAKRQSAEADKKAAEDAEQSASAADKPGKQAETAAADKKLKDAQKLEDAAAKTAAAAVAFTAASAAGTATPGAIFFPYKDRLSDNAVNNITLITSQVLSQAFTLDKCMAQLKGIADDEAKSPSAQLHTLYLSVLSLCQQKVEHQYDLQNRIQKNFEKLL